MSEFPDRQKVIDLAIRGFPPSDIVTMTGLSVHTVNGDISWARQRGVDIPAFKRGPKRSRNRVVHIPDYVLQGLAIHAHKMNTTPAMLATDILEQVVLDNLINAVLDKGGDDG